MIQEVLCTRAGFIPWGLHNPVRLSPAGARCTPSFAAQLLLQGAGGMLTPSRALPNGGAHPQPGQSQVSWSEPFALFLGMPDLLGWHRERRCNPGDPCQLFALLVPPSLNSTTCSFLERTAGTKELKLSHFSCCLSSIQHSCLSRRFSWLCLCVRTPEMGQGAHAANPMARGR